MLQAEDMNLRSTSKGPVEGVVIESTAVQGMALIFIIFADTNIPHRHFFPLQWEMSERVGKIKLTANSHSLEGKEKKFSGLLCEKREKVHISTSERSVDISVF